MWALLGLLALAGLVLGLLFGLGVIGRGGGGGGGSAEAGTVINGVNYDNNTVTI